MGGEVHRFLDWNAFRSSLVAKIGKAPVAAVESRFEAGICSCRLILDREILELLIELLMNITQFRRHEISIARMLRQPLPEAFRGLETGADLANHLQADVQPGFEIPAFALTLPNEQAQVVHACAEASRELDHFGFRAAGTVGFQ